jgi:sulfatase maturation enzyme AslB (radical SAM superfamily)
MDRNVQAGSIEQLRQQSRLSKPSTYVRPREGDLSAHIVAGKKALDEKTEFSLIEASAASLDAPDAVIVGSRHVIAKSEALPLRGPYSRRLIDGSYLWVDTAHGRVVVLSASLDAIMVQLCSGVAPMNVTDTVGLQTLIGLLARGDFIRGIKGHADDEIVDAKRFLRIHLTERCNLSCIHCYADSGPSLKSTGELSEDRWRELISEFAHLGGKRVLFTGGEALAYAGCDRRGGRLRRDTVSVSISGASAG